MSARDIDAHLQPFRSTGAAKIIGYDPAGPLGRGKPHFVMTGADARGVISRTGGDPRLMEKELGLIDGSLGDSPNLVTIHDPSNLRIPSGNEPGANRFWKPGGFTSGGVREAVIDGTSPSGYSWVPIPRSP